MSVEVINDTMVCREDSCGHVVHNRVLVDVSYTKEVRYCVLVCGKHISLKNPSRAEDFHHKVGRSVVTYRLGSSTWSGCKYRELVSEVRQGAVLNLFLPRMRRIVDFLWCKGCMVTKALTSGVNSLFLLPSF